MAKYGVNRLICVSTGTGVPVPDNVLVPTCEKCGALHPIPGVVATLSSVGVIQASPADSAGPATQATTLSPVQGDVAERLETPVAPVKVAKINTTRSKLKKKKA